MSLNDGNILPSNQSKLDSVFGTDKWRDVFFAASKQGDLFHQGDSLVKVADYNMIESFFVERLETVFAGVAKYPYRLFNSKGVWLYSMCFAAGNPKGKTIALKIANHILKERPWQRAQVSSGRT